MSKSVDETGKIKPGRYAETNPVKLRVDEVELIEPKRRSVGSKGRKTVTIQLKKAR